MFIKQRASDPSIVPSVVTGKLQHTEELWETIKYQVRSHRKIQVSVTYFLTGLKKKNAQINQDIALSSGEF